MNADRRRAPPRADRGSGTIPSFGRARTAVVIDEHAGLLGVLVEMLEHEGWKVSGFQRIDDALAYIRATLPDVVLTDLDVGETSGAALARELRLDPTTADITLVAMGGGGALGGSAGPTPETSELFDELLAKPIEITGLASALGLAIARRRT